MTPELADAIRSLPPCADGRYIERLADVSGLPLPRLHRIIDEMEAANRLYVRREGTNVFAAHVLAAAPPTAPTKSEAGKRRQDVTETAIIDALKASGGRLADERGRVTSRLAEMTGLPPTRLHGALTRLEATGRIHRSRVKEGVRLPDGPSFEERRSRLTFSIELVEHARLHLTVDVGARRSVVRLHAARETEPVHEVDVVADGPWMMRHRLLACVRSLNPAAPTVTLREPARGGEEVSRLTGWLEGALSEGSTFTVRCVAEGDVA